MRDCVTSGNTPLAYSPFKTSNRRFETRSSLAELNKLFRSGWLVVVMLAATFSVFTGEVRADVAMGKAAYKQCAGCHAVGPGATHRVGPQLNGLLERGAGAAEGYQYSAGFMDKVESGLEWNDETLGAYLEAPNSYIPGTRMSYPGLKDVQERISLVEYLLMIAADGSTGETPIDDPTSGSEPASVSKTAASQNEPAPLAKDVPVPEHGVLHLGRPALDAEITAWDIDVRPDGQGLPAGSGSVETGGELYDAQCASCHGVFGEGEGRWPMVAGGQDTLTDDRPEKTVGSYWPFLSTVYDYVRRAMPFGNSRSLSDDEVYALTAYLLYMNDIVDEEFVLDSKNFKTIEMPNAANFIADTRPDEPWFEAAEEPCMKDCFDDAASVSKRAQILDVTPDNEADGAGGGGLD